jgi:hypothetical protein
VVDIGQELVSEETTPADHAVPHLALLPAGTPFVKKTPSAVALAEELRRQKSRARVANMRAERYELEKRIALDRLALQELNRREIWEFEARKLQLEIDTMNESKERVFMITSQKKTAVDHSLRTKELKRLKYAIVSQNDLLTEVTNFPSEPELLFPKLEEVAPMVEERKAIVSRAATRQKSASAWRVEEEEDQMPEGAWAGEGLIAPPSRGTQQVELRRRLITSVGGGFRRASSRGRIMGLADPETTAMSFDVNHLFGGSRSSFGEEETNIPNMTR